MKICRWSHWLTAACFPQINEGALWCHCAEMESTSCNPSRPTPVTPRPQQRPADKAGFSTCAEIYDTAALTLAYELEQQQPCPPPLHNTHPPPPLKKKRKEITLSVKGL